MEREGKAMNQTPAPNRLGIELKLTDRCNFACFHCMNSDSPKKSRNLDIDLFLSRFADWRRASAGLGVRLMEVRMTGGEPLICAEGVLKIARSMSAVAVPCGVNTNGILLSSDLAAKMKGAGIGIVKISMDSLDEDTLRRMRGDHFSVRKLLNGVRNALEHDLKVILRFTLCRYNLAELMTCFKFAKDMGVYKFQVKPLIPSGRGRYFDASLAVESIKNALRELYREMRADDDFLEVLCFPETSCSDARGRSCASLEKIYVDANMDVTTCNYIAGHGRLGNFAQDSFEEIQRRRQAMLQKTTLYNRRPFLSGCPLFETEGGQRQVSRSGEPDAASLAPSLS